MSDIERVERAAATALHATGLRMPSMPTFQPLSGEQFGQIVERGFGEVDGDGGWWLLFKCRGCGVPLRLPADGLSLAAFRLAPRACEQCAEKERQVEEKQRDLRETEERFRLSGLPEELWELRWEKLFPSEHRDLAVAALQAWAEDRDARGVYLWGSIGVGKTTFAAAAAAHRMRNGHNVRWVSLASLLAQLDASFTDRARGEALKVLAGHTPLVLDDLDKANPTEHRRTQIFTAIDQRYTHNVPMIFTSNLPPASLEDRYGEAIASRVLGFCRRRLFKIDGHDRRMDS